MSTKDINSRQDKPDSKLTTKAFSFLLIVLIFAVAVMLFIWLKQTKPKAKQRPRVKVNTIVETQKATVANQNIYIEAMGTVSPAKSITLTSLVGGEIVKINPHLQPGTYFKAGENILTINPSDYKLIVQQREADVAVARNELTMEYGNQLVAKREFELLGETVSEKEQNLMLRRPQLDNLQATLTSAKARLEQAKLDLARTQLIAPFNGVISSLDTNIGARASIGSTLVTFTGVDEFWLDVFVPVSQLQWITIPKKESNHQGSRVKIYNDTVWDKGHYREGEVVRLMPELETNGRMARLIVRVKDPLALKKDDSPALLINSYVRVVIDCGEINDVIAIERKYIRSGNQLWVIDKDSNLDIRNIETLFASRDKIILAKGITSGEYFVTSPIASPVLGMTLTIKETPSSKDPSQSRKKKTQGSKVMKQDEDNG